DAFPRVRPQCRSKRRSSLSDVSLHHLEKGAETCYGFLMGRNFENRKNAIFKTAGQKSKLYSKYGKQLYVVAKNGVADPEANPGLRSLIEQAKRDKVRAHVIDKAVEKARGAGGENFESVRYEGFGPGGSMVIV